jgi:acyl-CoA reductase-like NAD-dependent aldehyde dehydrogenase
MLAEVAQAAPADIEAAIQGMQRGAAPLRKLPAYKRADACAHIHRRLIERTEEFARTIAREAGKPIRTARGEVQRAISTFKLAAEEATRISGEQLPVEIDPRGEGYQAIVERFPIGPCSFITPFNFPLNLVAHKVAPALAAGCPFIIKPSERTPLTALLLGDLLAECNLPEGTFSVLPCDRATAKPLVADDRIKLLSFTGSPDVGFKMKSAAGKKQVVLELGNNSAVIVEPETDKVMNVPRIVTGAFGYAGQSCISVQRIYLHESVAERMIEMLQNAAEKLIVGDPLDEKTDVGPMIDAAAADRIMQWIAESGGSVLCGNRREGNLVWPTLVAGADPASKLVREEAFGPVAVIDTYRDFGEVLRQVNDSRFGLQAGLFSQDQRKIRRAFEELEVGGLVINDVPTTRIDNMPYGGIKDSGLGREGVKYAIEHMTERKVLLVRGP